MTEFSEQAAGPTGAFEPVTSILVTGGSGFIGSYLIDALRRLDPGHRIRNLDVRRPQIRDHEQHWVRADILDANVLTAQFLEFAPSHVIHLAARTDTDSDDVGDYGANVHGSSNVIQAVASTESVRRLILTSTQYVLRPGVWPTHDEHFGPHTAYGESKVLTERALRSAGLRCAWVIVRPTNIWGPRHPRYPHEFWKVVSKGLYHHPRTESVVRAYGYVGNVASQIIQALVVPEALVDRRVFYLGDAPMALHEWVDGFSLVLRGRPVRRVPISGLRALALAGDGLHRLRIPFPLNSSRLANITESNLVPMQPTFDVLGSGPFTLQAGIEETADWLWTQGFRRPRTFSRGVVAR